MKGMKIYCACIILVVFIAVGDCSPKPHKKSGLGRADIHTKAVHAPSAKSGGTNAKADATAEKPDARCFGLDFLGALWPWGSDSDDGSDDGSDDSSGESDEKKKSDKGPLGKSGTDPNKRRNKFKKGS